MRQILVSLMLAAAASGTAAAQTPAGRPTDDPLAVKPVPASSETSRSDVIRSKIERIGYTHVTDLTRDSTGIWHAHAIRDDQPVAIAVDKGGRIKPETH
jgi:hypothetical protein